MNLYLLHTDYCSSKHYILVVRVWVAGYTCLYHLGFGRGRDQKSVRWQCLHWGVWSVGRSEEPHIIMLSPALYLIITVILLLSHTRPDRDPGRVGIPPFRH